MFRHNPKLLLLQDPPRQVPIIFGLTEVITGTAADTFRVRVIGHARELAEPGITAGGNILTEVITGVVAAGDNPLYFSSKEVSIIYASVSAKEAGAFVSSIVKAKYFVVMEGKVKMRFLPMVVPSIRLITAPLSS